MALLVVVTMLFVAFTSVYLQRVFRVGYALPFPPALWFSTTALLLSSLSMERARAAAKAGHWLKARSALLHTGLLGLLFAVGQFMAWRDLISQGIYLQTNPHSSFFYLLTLIHILHLAGGILWLLIAYSRLRFFRPFLRLVQPPRPAQAVARDTAADVAAGAEGVALCATYWHFLGGLWLYLFVLLCAF